jgi:hypothetical protein
MQTFDVTFPKKLPNKIKRLLAKKTFVKTKKVQFVKYKMPYMHRGLL